LEKKKGKDRGRYFQEEESLINSYVSGKKEMKEPYFIIIELMIFKKRRGGGGGGKGRN